MSFNNVPVLRLDTHILILYQMNLFRIPLLAVMLCVGWMARAQALGERNDFLRYVNDPRVDSIYHHLTPDERIAQLFWLMTENLHDPKSVQRVMSLVQTFQPGGLLYMRNTAADIVRFSAQASAVSRVPLIYSIDGETGAAMRVKGIRALPKAMTLGAIADERLLYRAGDEAARQLRGLGIHVNFAPVADVNVNAANPVIGIRSFGEDPHEVARRAVALMHGMQDGGVVAVAKHFPGHGDTDVDSHLALPVIGHTRARLDTVELVPFDAMIKNGVMGVMSAHLEVNALDTTRGLPASLSKPMLTDLLCHGMGFQGVVITDAMNMKGVKKAGQPGRVDALALAAGNDIVESTEDLGAAITSVKQAIDAGELTWCDIERKCRKALALKLWAGCGAPLPEPNDSLVTHINSGMDATLLPDLYRAALTVLPGAADTVALTPDSTEVLLLVMPGGKALADSIAAHRPAKRLNLVVGAKGEVIRQQLGRHAQVVICTGGFADARKVWNDAALAPLWRWLWQHNGVRVVVADSPYRLHQLKNIERAREVVLVYEAVPEAFQAAALYLSGQLTPVGRLPVTVSNLWRCGQGK